ncbi:MAG: hypothetical protein KYX66_22105 [Blastomonas fulva]|nr:hypothetical protein [Blastomonas fulva]MDK2759422.1 hypothetical protein [Blastomonas fulva]
MTASHGGIILSDQRQAAMPPALLIDGGSYEEDCDWALPILAFSSELERQGSCSAGFLQLARDTAKCWHPDRFSAFTGEAVEENASTILRTRKAYIAAIGEFCVTTAWGDWADWVPEGKVGVIGRQVERVDHLGRPTYGEAEVCALIAKDLYAARGEVTALRDTAHEIIPLPEALRPKRVG